MGKPKKGKKDQQEEEIDDISEDVGQLKLDDSDANDAPAKPAKKQKAKKKKKQQLSDSDDDQVPQVVDTEVKVIAKAGKVKAGFNMLSVLGDEGDAMDDDDDDKEDVKPVAKSKKPKAVADPENDRKPDKKLKKKDKKKKNDDDDDIDAILAAIEAPTEKKGKKSKKKEQIFDNVEDESTDVVTDDVKMDENDDAAKADGDTGKKGKKKKKHDDDLTAEDLAAMIESKGVEKVMTIDDLENEYDDFDDKKKKRKGKKDTKKTEVKDSKVKDAGVGDAEMKDAEVKNAEVKDSGVKNDEVKDIEMKDEGEDNLEEGTTEVENETTKTEEGLTMKTAAQKKKDKKDREKKDKDAKKKKDKIQKKPKVEGVEGEVEEGDAEEGAAEEEDEKVSSKKKKKGKKDEKEKKDKKDKDKDKKPKNKQIAAIREHLRKLQEEEERFKWEQEEKERIEEEARQKIEEDKRLAEEKKQLKRQRQKDLIEQQKKDGTYLTAKQKADKKRAEEMLASMRAQGLIVPDRDHIKANRFQNNRQRKPRPPKDTLEAKKTEEPPSPSVIVPPEVEVTKEETVECVDDVKDEWDMSSESEDDTKESKDVKIKEPPVETIIETKTVTKTETKTETKGDTKTDTKTETKTDTKTDNISISTSKKPVIVKQKSKDRKSVESSSEGSSSSSEESSDEDSSSEDEDDQAPLARARESIQKRYLEAEKKRSVDVLRAPVVCVLGHVDTGKTKILDKLRRTNVQDGEAGGITQQIGATNVPREAILDKTKMCTEFQTQGLKLPGMLIIDTPGHESFSNLRTRGSSLCDIAVLVVDIMHGIEPQTLESINLLRARKTPFIIALNKIDRLYQWKSSPHIDVMETVKNQHAHTKLEFEKRVSETIVAFAEQSLNATLFHENKNPREYISMVPTSAHSGDGMGNLLALLCQLSQTLLAKKISYSEEIQATVMEVKALPGLGTTIDVIVVNGVLREGNTIVIAGTDGPIVTQIRGLLLPQPMKELRVKNQYNHIKELQAAQGVKIIGKDFEKAIAGLPFYVAQDLDEVLFYKTELSRALEDVLGGIRLSDRGVFVQASTIGSLEALLEFLKTSKIQFAGINIGPVHKKDVMKASVMLEHDTQFAVILAFDIKVEREAQEMADSMGVRIFHANIIYHLFDQFMAFREELKKGKQEEFRHVAVYPCKIRILPQFIFNSRDPIVAGVLIEAGQLKVGTPICVPSKEFLDLGRVSSIEFNHKVVESARKGQEVCIKIESSTNDAPKMFGRHFDHTDLLVSKISRESIDVMKEWFRDELQKSDWQLMVELKKKFDII